MLKYTFIKAKPHWLLTAEQKHVCKAEPNWYWIAEADTNNSILKA